MKLDIPTSGGLSAGKQTEHIGFTDAQTAYEMNTDWWTVYAAFDLPDFTANPIWISKKTGISITEVVEALEGLTMIGLLRRDDRSFYPVKDKGTYNLDVTSKTKSQTIKEHVITSSQILNHLTVESSAFIDKRTFATNIEIVRELYSDISKAYEKAMQKSQESKTNDRIYKMTFTAVDVLPKAQESTGRGN